MQKNRKNVIPAKITRPAAKNSVQRTRLFRLLDRARRKPLVWISSFAGSGKTALISSFAQAKNISCLWYRCDEGDADLSTFFYYMSLAAADANPRRASALPLLTPEYLPGITAFTRKYFEDLGSSMKKPGLIVFDNYHAIPEAASFHEMLAAGLDALPEGVAVIVMSRQGPPLAFMSLQAKDRAALIGWDEMRFTRAETRALAANARVAQMSQRTIDELDRMSDGWAAAIVLLLERARVRGGMEGGEEFASDRIFDYFGEHMGSDLKIELLTSSP